ncbi:TPA: hypothetical protein U1344_002128 [Streptococcus suis]|nr:hypothetical protein [Streptococcus suis]
MIAQNKNGELDQEILNLEKEIKKMEAKSQQEGLSINSPSQLPDSLLNSVNKKGRQVFDELDVEVI